MSKKQSTPFTIESLREKGFTETENNTFIPSNKANTAHFGKTMAGNINSVKPEFKSHTSVDRGPSQISGGPAKVWTWAGRNMVVFEITPVSAPRMTQSDKWKTNPLHRDPKKRQRKPVTQYWKFREEIKKLAADIGFTMPEEHFHVIFFLPMPYSWSEKKKSLMYRSPHQQKPDADNMIKALKDSLCKSDAHIWDYRITKIWGNGGIGRIIIQNIPHAEY